MGGQFKFEEREYGPESTEEEIEAFKSLIYVVDENIVFINEPPVCSIFQEDICHDKILEITQELPKFFLLLDISDTLKPSMEVRNHIEFRFRKLQDRIIHMALIRSKNILVSMLLKYNIPRIMGAIPISYHATVEEGIAKLKEIKSASS